MFNMFLHLFALVSSLPCLWKVPVKPYPMPHRMIRWSPKAFKNSVKGQWVVFLKKGSHRARFSGLVSKVEKGKVTLTNTKEYTEDKNGNVKRQQSKGDVVFEVETVCGELGDSEGCQGRDPQG